MYLNATNAVPMETKTVVQFTSKLINKMIEKDHNKDKVQKRLNNVNHSKQQQ